MSTTIIEREGGSRAVYWKDTTSVTGTDYHYIILTEQDGILAMQCCITDYGIGLLKELIDGLDL
jgi:hypothetical protein